MKGFKKRPLSHLTDDPYVEQVFEAKYYNGLLGHCLSCGYILRRPLLTFKDLKKIDSSLTYRCLNEWESRGLISSTRHVSKRGWRRFSITQAVELLFVIELKRFGMSSSRIGKVMEYITYRYEYCSISELYIFLSNAGFHIGVIVQPDGNVIIHQTEELLKVYTANINYPTAFLYAPFSDYVLKVWNSMGEGFEFYNRNLYNLIPPKYLETLRIIFHDEYEEIKILKKNDKVHSIKKISRRSGDFSKNELLRTLDSADYKRLEVYKKSGKIITIVNEDIIKL